MTEPEQKPDSQPDLITLAEKAAERLEAANKIMAEQLVKMEEMTARKLLGGQASAGQVQPEPTKAEVIKAGMQKYFKGTALEGAIK